MTQAAPYSRHPVVAVYRPDAERVGFGIYSLADISARCRIDDDTGCWHWRLAMRANGASNGSKSLTPSVSVPAGVLGDKRRTLSVARVVWLMQGKTLRPGWVVWRTCTSEDCCAPEHLKAGTKADEGAWMRASGRRRGVAHRLVVNSRNVASQAVPAEKVREVAEQINAGRLYRDIAADLGVHKATISKIANGKHYHQRAKGARGSSVFHQMAGGGA